ncbi:MAG: ArsR family transcriptional regulator [Anaerolineales bacterium]|nr:ArsR family transcriptional regulator [Anaerolineales bacterium]
MQTRRQEILIILKRNGEATVDELACMLDLTPVTVRHHLDILRAEGLVRAPAVRRRHGPGRPQFVYTLTEEAADHFPQGYETLADELLREIKATMGEEVVKELFDRIAALRLQKAPRIDAKLPLNEKLDILVNYLSNNGFIASWEEKDGNWFLHASNCPCQSIAMEHPEICVMDKFIMENLVGVKVKWLQRIADGAYTCIYQILSDTET